MTAVNYVMRFLAGLAGVVWASIEPTLPWAAVCVMAVIVDCISAARLNMRVKKAYPQGGAEGKFQSRHAMKILSTLGMVYGCVILAYWTDTLILPHIDMHLGQYVAAAFCLVTLTSILENESTLNPSSWARLLQRVLADKTKRHLKIDITDPNFKSTEGNGGDEESE